jgi:DNA repair protein RecN (Recombination protein N)
MLTVLHIRHLALVESLTWELGAGLICVTGETGAGKSVIVGALKLVLGERAERGLIRTGEEQCSVEASFEVARPEAVDEILERAGLAPCEDGQLVIKRVISASGGNRQFVNCSPATLSVLKELGGHLVDLHGPHAHQSLLSRERQLAMLDAYAGAGELLGRYGESYRAWRGVWRELDEIDGAGRVAEAEIEILRHHVGEIEAAALREGEEEELERRYRVASNGRRLGELCGRVVGRLRDDAGSVLEGLAEVGRLAGEIERADPGAAELFAGFGAAQVELQEIAEGLEAYAGDIELDPEALGQMEERINVIEMMKRKHGGGSVAGVLARYEEMAARLARIEGREEAVGRLREEEREALGRVREVGAELERVREEAAPRLAAEIAGQLGALGFRQSAFEVELTQVGMPEASGFDEVDFLFGPNPGEPSRPLRQIASSGEMSRVMLAIKSALADQDQIPLLVFDEIDANVGGEIAQAVGRKMAVLGETHQIISITHLPQVASLAQRHYVVTKLVEGERTRSELREVEGEGRIAELARMLGGGEESARAHARALMAG